MYQNENHNVKKIIDKQGETGVRQSVLGPWEQHHDSHAAMKTAPSSAANNNNNTTINDKQ